MDFIGLHNHSDYSNIRLIDSINKCSRLVDVAYELGHCGVALTDHESLSGHVEIYNHVKKRKEENPEDERWQNFKLVLGNEIYLCRNGLNKATWQSGIDKYYHFILLAKDDIGINQLRQLSSRAWLRSYRQYLERVPTYYKDIEEVTQSSKGHLIASSACLGGWLPSKIMEYGKTRSVVKQKEIKQSISSWIAAMQNLFGKENFYLEIQPGYTEEQMFVNEEIVNVWAPKTDTKIIITTDSHYWSKEVRTIHKRFLNSKEGDREVDDFYASTYMMSTDEIQEYFKDTSFAARVKEFCANTVEIADKIGDYTMEESAKIPKTEQKPLTEHEQEKLNTYQARFSAKFPNIAKMCNSNYLGEKVLAYKVLTGAEKKKIFDKFDPEEVFSRIDREFKTIFDVSENYNQHMVDYFLTVANIVNIMWTEGDSIVGPSRGSALGFLTSYLLDIVQVNPLGKETPTPDWRFLNSERISLPDIDLDSQSNRRDRIIKALKQHYGDHRTINVCTFGTEKSKNAINVAFKGSGIDNDIALYYSSIVPIDRGEPRKLSVCLYGDEDNSPVPKIVEMQKKYPEVMELALAIEGLITRRGIHAAGIIITNEDFTNHNALMTAPNGEIISQYDLGATEQLGGVKFDCLTVKALDRIRECMDLLTIYGKIERKPTLKETYMSIIDPESTLVYDDENMWKKAGTGAIINLFQFDTPQGGECMRKAQPQNIYEMAQINSLMRLMTDGEPPIDTYIRYKNNIYEWENEMKSAGLDDKEQQIVKKHLAKSKGVAESQELMMLLAMDEHIANFTLKEADKLRKAVAKKNPIAFEESKSLFYEKGQQFGTSRALLDYIWRVQIERQRGYSFSSLHTLGYSIIAVQEMNLAYRWPTIYWNTANLIVDSGNSAMFNDAESMSDWIIENEDDDETTNNLVDYGAISTAIGKTKNYGIEVKLPDINKSLYTFTPDEEKNVIYYGIKGITRLSDVMVSEIMVKRPFTSFNDFMERIKFGKLPMINLIKSGAFNEFGDCNSIMNEYLNIIAETKKLVNLRNMKSLIATNSLGDEFAHMATLYNIHQMVKPTGNSNVQLTYEEFNALEEHWDVSFCNVENNFFTCSAAEWKKFYEKSISPLRAKMKKDTEILDRYNAKLIATVREKYATGNISKWEMDSVGFYYHEHELANVNKELYNIENFTSLNEDGDVLKLAHTPAGIFPVYKLCNVVGTVINKDKTKSTITLLSPDGVFNVKFNRDIFGMFDKQISEVQPDGKKKIIERSWFKRGNKLVVHGRRRGHDFVAKKGSNKNYAPVVQLITQVNEDGSLELRHDRLN